ncbi:hypothetical protein BDB00DRAFT_870642 [Zychaea mexicana]|uniref:uncharacterized protein n=1 Tax=Zychaea mexicana TaxID=64656 RepID=UPI0022FF35B2|nr:uncharacterized protein BDB00DRAFT_870642 [Zychaea mexicana]KAI9495187.1 hypothetical protein BDB00DRAFT_870642 [Zychaea mexicana]
MPPSQDITADSFRFKKPIQSTGRRKAKAPTRVRKRRQPLLSQTNPLVNSNPNCNRSSSLIADLHSLVESDQDPISSADCVSVLEGVIMVIDKQLWEAQRLEQQAAAMGAEVSPNMNKTVTHVVHSPVTTVATKAAGRMHTHHQQQPRLVAQALNSGARLVSPLWVEDCYKQKKRLPESYYPFDADPSQQTPRLSLEENGDQTEENPFHVDATVYAVSSDSEEEEGRIDNQNDTDDDGGGYENEEEDVNGSVHRQQQLPCESLRQQQRRSPVTDNEDNADEDEEVLLRRRQKRTAAISKILQAVRENKERQQQQQQLQQQQQKQENVPSSLPTDELEVGYLGSEEKHNVWYGEQSFYNHDSSSSTKAAAVAAAASESSASRRRESHVRRSTSSPQDFKRKKR